MEKGVHAEREQELDDVDPDLDDEEDGDEDDEDDEEDDEDEEPEPAPPAPGRRPPHPPAMTAKPPERLNREDIKTIILEMFAEGKKSREIHKFFITENIVDEETGEPLSIRQIGGFKSLTFPNSGGAVTPPTVEKSKLIVPRPRTTLETFKQMLEEAEEKGNLALAQMAVDGIYSEINKGAHGGGTDDKIWELFKLQLESGKGKSKLSELKELTEIVKNLMPAQPEGKSEAVQMAEVMSGTSLEIAREAKDTALQITGSKHEADKMGKCPSCNKMIPMDSLYCAYCGLAFKQKFEVEGEEAEEEDEEEVKARQRADMEKKKRADIARRAVAGRRPQPPPPRPSASQPTPQPVKPQAPAPQPAAPPPAPAPQPAGPAISPEERAAILHNLKRLANFIAAKDDPVLKTQALFKAGDGDDRKQGLFLAIVGRERLLKAARRLIQEHKELVDFQNYVELCDSVDGRAWIDTSFMELMKQAKLNGILLKKEEAATMLDKVEARLGFPID